MDHIIPDEIFRKSFEVFSKDGRDKDVAASHAFTAFLRGVQSGKMSIVRAKKILEDNDHIAERIEQAREQIKKISPEIISDIMIKIRDDMSSVLAATQNMEHVSTHIEQVSTHLAATSETLEVVSSKVAQTEKNTSTWPNILIGAGSSLVASFIYAGIFGLLVHHSTPKAKPDAKPDIRNVFKSVQQDHTSHVQSEPYKAIEPDTSPSKPSVPQSRSKPMKHFGQLVPCGTHP